MKDAPVRVLLVEDDEDDYIITRDLLSDSQGTRFELERVATCQDALKEIKRNRHDVYLLDYRLGERTGLEIICEAVENGCKAPMILLTGQGDHEIDIEAMQAGAADYLMKGALETPLLERSIRYALNRAKTLAELQRSRESLAHAQRIARLGNWEWDLETNELECSEEGYRILGLLPQAQKMSANAFREFIHPDDVDNFQAAYDKALGNREPLTSDHRIVHADGTERAVHLHGDVVRGDAGEPVRITGTVQDITERRLYEQSLEAARNELEHRVEERTAGLRREIAERQRTESALRESQQRLRAITDNLFDGVLVIDANGHIMFANRSAETLLHRQGGGLAGQQVDDIFLLRQDDKDIRFADGPFCGIIESGETYRDDDAVFINREGTLLNIALGCLPLLEDGKRHGAIISFRDIQELKAAQNEALQASRLASVGQLAAGIAHEINTPIQYIGDNLRFLNKAHEDISSLLDTYRTLAQAARKTDLLEDYVAKVDAGVEEADFEYLLQEMPTAIGQSLSGVDQVSRIVLAMKEFSHPGTTAKTATDLNQAIENTLTVCSNEWKHRAAIDVELDATLPLVTCLPGEMNQVFLNLIINAAHAIEEVGKNGAGHISIVTRQDGDWAEVRITDSGGGIPEKIRERVFDPFFTTKEVGKGTGQGLAICRDIVVNKHGGKISFNCQQGKGTEFIVRLPINEIVQARAT